MNIHCVQTNTTTTNLFLSVEGHSPTLQENVYNGLLARCSSHHQGCQSLLRMGATKRLWSGCVDCIQYVSVIVLSLSSPHAKCHQYPRWRCGSYIYNITIMCHSKSGGRPVCTHKGYYTPFTLSNIALIHCAIHRYMPCTTDFSRGFWYGTLPCPFTIEGTKLLAASTSAVEWYKFHAHTSFLSEVIMYANSM